MNGLDPAIQLAAALDRRGVTVTIHREWVRVWLREYEYMVIRPSISGPVHDMGKSWSWEHNGKYWSHPRDDWEGVAELVATYIAEDRAFVGTAARLRVDRMAGRKPRNDRPRPKDGAS
jgi:hypothetical protein